MRTAWGYEVESLEPLLSAQQFDAMTGNAYSGDRRAESALRAASQAVRNYCGWHISPAMACTAYPAGGGIVAKLPAAYVSAIESVTENGEELDESSYEWRRDGLIKRKKSKEWSSDWDSIEVRYTAGYDIEAVPDLAEAVRAITESVMAVSAGVTSESADGVSISYSASASSIAAALTASQKAALDAYKVVSSHAA